MSCEESLTLLVGGALGEGRRGLSKDGLPIRVWMGGKNGAVVVLVNRREMKNDERFFKLLAHLVELGALSDCRLENLGMLPALLEVLELAQLCNEVRALEDMRGGDWGAHAR